MNDPLVLFYTYHSFEDDNQRDDWYMALSRDEKAALLDMRQMIESDPVIAMLCGERGGVVTLVEMTGVAA